MLNARVGWIFVKDNSGDPYARNTAELHVNVSYYSIQVDWHTDLYTCVQDIYRELMLPDQGAAYQSQHMFLVLLCYNITRIALG